MSKQSKQFVHLHVHSDYSLLDGAAPISDIVRFAAGDKQPGVAITDHGYMSGTVQLFRHAKDAGITPIPGLEAYHVPSVAKMKERNTGGGKSRFHMILLATSTVGYQNLMRLSSEAHLENFYYQPNVDDEMLARYSEGVVATSGCLGSQFNQALLKGDVKLATKIAGKHQDIFGVDNFFIEIQNHGIEDQLKVLPLQLRVAKDIGAPLLATNDSHYIKQSDAKMHDALLAVGTKSLLEDSDRFRFDGENNYMRTAEEMYELFPNRDFPDACSNTLLIEEMARGNIDIGYGKENFHLIPEFPTPDKVSSSEHLAKITWEGAKTRYGDDDGKIPQSVKRQIEYELGVIHDMGFDDYFLIVSDIVTWSKSNGIYVGPGRGSAAGSAVAYCTSITNVDPIRHGLRFERFLNPGRRSMPDIDIDFDPQRRGEVHAYLANKYPGKVAYISTYGVLKPKSAMLAATRVLGYPVSLGQTMSRMWPGVVNQKEADLSEIMRDKPSDPSWKDHWAIGAGLRNISSKDDRARKAIELAISFEGIRNQKGTHAGGLLITPGPLADHVPLHQDKQPMLSIPVCSYDLYSVEAIGGLKMDLLGVINLSVISRTVALIKDDLGKKIDVDNIPLDDQKVYKMLSNGDSDGVFQLESPGMRDLLKRVKPTSIDDISAVIALYRPGPMGSNLHLQYADSKNGKIKIEVPEKNMHKMFKDTHSALVYQEQLIDLVIHYAGYSAAEADDFRRGVGKKDAALIASMESQFKKSVVANGYSESVARKLWDMIPPFAAYAFNKSHSVAYAYISYQTAWLKVNYPAQYAAACIDYLSAGRVFAQVENARRSGVRIFPPDINSSREQATTANESVWLGLNGIANCGPASLATILGARENGGGEFTDLSDFLVRASKVNRKSVTALISAGCFDSLHGSRKAMHDHLDEMIASARKIKNNGVAEDYSDGLFGDMLEGVSIKTAAQVYDLDGPDYSISERVSQEIWALGFPASRHPFYYVKEYLKLAGSDNKFISPQAVPVGEEELVEGEQITLYGTVGTSSFQEGKANQKPKASFHLETDSGESVKCTSFGYELASLQSGDLMIATGTLVTYVVGGEEYQEFRVSSGKFIQLDKIAEESERLKKSGAKPQELSEGQRSERATSDRRESRRRGTTTSSKAFIFKVKSEKQIEQLIAALNDLDAGNTRVYIRTGGKIGSSDDGYDLSEKKASKIADKLGIKVKVGEPELIDA